MPEDLHRLIMRKAVMRSQHGGVGYRQKAIRGTPPGQKSSLKKEMNTC